MVACPFRKSGCDFVGKLELSSSHKKTCIFNPSNMPEFIKKADKNKENKPVLSKHSDGKIFILIYVHLKLFNINF